MYTAVAVPNDRILDAEGMRFGGAFLPPGRLSVAFRLLFGWFPVAFGGVCFLFGFFMVRLFCVPDHCIVLRIGCVWRTGAIDAERER